MTRREYGTGSLYLRKSDGRWVGAVSAGWTAKGTRRRIPVSAKTRKEAARKLAKLRAEIAAGGLPARGARTTVKTWADTWLADYATRVRPKAYGAAAGAIRSWVIPTIGTRVLADLTPADIRSASQAAINAGRSPNTARAVHRNLKTMLSAALVEGHPVPPRVLQVKGPEEAVTDRTAIAVPEALALIREAGTLDHGIRWIFALLYGCRQGECLGLTWDHVDLDNGEVELAWQLQVLPYRDVKNKALGFRAPTSMPKRHLTGRYHLTPPKSKAGTRVVPLMPWTIDALAEWRELAPPSPWGLVWPSAVGGPASAGDDFEEWCGLQDAARVGHQAGRYYYLHECRNTAATLLRDTETDPTVITALLGHSTVAMSQAYMRTGRKQKLEAVRKVAGVLGLD